MADEVTSAYPANNRQAKEQAVQKSDRPRLEKIVKGEVTSRKKPLGRRIAETFTGEDARSVADYILLDVIVPAVKSTISDAVSQGVERMLFGESSTRRTRSASGNGSKSYDRMYKPMGSNTPGENRRQAVEEEELRWDMIVYPGRGEAEGVLDALREAISKYTQVSVFDLYDLVGKTGEFTDNRWGWTDLRTARVVRDRDGFRIELPKPEEL